jgi:excisionase family DNA binding protein
MDDAIDPRLFAARLLRIEEAAALLGVSAATVRRWCADGRLEGVALPGRRSGLRIRSDRVAVIIQGRKLSR